MGWFRSTTVVPMLIVTLLLVRGAAADDRFEAVPAGLGEGPVLLFYAKAVAPPRLGTLPTIELYAFNPRFHKEPQVIWRGTDATPRIVAIADANTLVLPASTVDVRTGKRTPLAETENNVRVVTVRGPNVYFLEQLEAEDHGSVVSGEGDKHVLKGSSGGRHRLYVRKASDADAAAKSVTNFEIESVIGQTDDTLWAISAGKPRHLYRVPLKPETPPEQIMPVDDHWAARMTSCEVSPNGRYLAIGSMHDEQDIHEARAVCIYDLEKQTTVFRKDDATHYLPGCNFAMPQIVTWLNDGQLRYGIGRRGIVEAPSGNHITDLDEVERIEMQVHEEEKRIAKSEAASRPRNEDKPFPRDSFVKFGTLTEVALSPAGTWAAVGPSKEERVYFLDGTAESEQVIHPSGGWGLEWFEPGKVVEQRLRDAYRSGIFE